MFIYPLNLTINNTLVYENFQTAAIEHKHFQNHDGMNHIALLSVFEITNWDTRT